MEGNCLPRADTDVQKRVASAMDGIACRARTRMSRSAWQAPEGRCAKVLRGTVDLFHPRSVYFNMKHYESFGVWNA